MKLKNILIISFLVSIAILIPSNIASAKTLIVDKNHGFKTIQEALDEAEENDTILISSGEYNENLKIKTNYIEIIGEDVRNTFLKSKNSGSGYGIEIEEGLHDIKILNINISEYFYGIYSSGSSDMKNITLNNLTLENNGDLSLPENCTSQNPYRSCSNWHDQGGSIKLKNLNQSLISNLIISGNEKGILIYDSATGENIIDNNQIFDNQQYGIRLNNGGSDNKISWNTIYDNFGEGIEIYRTDNEEDTSLIVKSNQIYQNKNDGLRVENQRDYTIEYNSFSNNASTNNTPYSPGQDPIFGAIYINSSDTGEIHNNNFDSNGKFGIFIDSNSSNSKIYNNLFEDQEEIPQVSDNGSINTFYLNQVGNYWSDLGENSEYSISGTTGNTDIHPLSSYPGTIQNNGINLFISEYKPSSISLKWNEIDDDSFLTYEINYYKNSDLETTLNRYTNPSLKDSSITSLSINNLESDQQYSVYITAIDSNNNEINRSDIISFKTTYDVESDSPKEVEIHSIENGEIYLSWFPNQIHGNTKYYEIYRSSGENDFEYIGKSIHPNSYYYDINLNPKLTYNYKVRAVYEEEISAFSNTVSITPDTTLNLDPERNINKFNHNDISGNTILSLTTDNRSELVFTPELANNLTNEELILNGLTTQENDYPIKDINYSYIDSDIYYYSLSQVKNFISIETLPKEALLTIKYTNSSIEHKIEENLVIGYFDPVKENWIPLLSEINPNSNTITARINYLGIYKILYRNLPLNLSDVSQSDWVYGYINNLSRSDIIKGYDDLTFRPMNSASRAEVLKMKIKAMGLKTPLHTFEDPCTDVSKDEWYAPYFQLAISIGLINGYPDGTCKPNQPISRIEALKVIIGQVPNNPSGAINFTDADDLSDWAIPYIKYANEYSIIGGYKDNTFRPNNNILRQEIAKILYQYHRLN